MSLWNEEETLKGRMNRLRKNCSKEKIEYIKNASSFWIEESQAPRYAACESFNESGHLCIVDLKEKYGTDFENLIQIRRNGYLQILNYKTEECEFVNLLSNDINEVVKYVKNINDIRDGKNETFNKLFNR